MSLVMCLAIPARVKLVEGYKVEVEIDRVGRMTCPPKTSTVVMLDWD